MKQVRSYRDLKVWQSGMDLAEQCYLITRRFPRDELFGLTSQIRRAASSIPANIAEGWGREGTAEYIQFLRIAQGSLKELETHLLLSERVGLVTTEQTKPILQRTDELGRMIHSLLGSLKRRKNGDA